MSNGKQIMGKLIQFVLYLLTAVAIAFSGYLHLDFAVQGINNLRLIDILTNFPIILLLISCLLLVMSAFMSTIKPTMGNKVALIAASIGCVYYVISACLLFLLASILILILPKSWLFFSPCVLLILTIIYSSRAISTQSSRPTSTNGHC